MDKKAGPTHMLSDRDSSQNKRVPQAESKGMEENIPCKWKQKKLGLQYLYVTKQTSKQRP